MSFAKLMVVAAMYSHYTANDPIELPQIELPPVQEIGVASWYGDGAMHGDVTANGEAFDPTRFTCAHRELPFDTLVMIVNRSNRRRVWCRINDRGPYGVKLPDGSWAATTQLEPGTHWRGIIDMSVATARELGTIDRGLQRVELRYWTNDRSRVFNLAAMDRQYP
jgi:rare lipoprotein A